MLDLNRHKILTDTIVQVNDQLDRVRSLRK